MKELYPFKFTPILFDKIWGGAKLKSELNKPISSQTTGESWEISGVPGYESEIANGYLSGNNLEELIEVYMGDLVGDRIYNEFGTQFPLLVKFIDANDVLSIQVHPNDQLARKRHNSFGKTEMWYVMQANPGAELIVGFNCEVDRETYLKHVNEKKLPEILNYEQVEAGDVFLLPAGRVHAIGSGILLAEIQQTSDITYRIYDFDRRDAQGNLRDLHTDAAVDAIDFTTPERYKTNYKVIPNFPSTLVSCPYFTSMMIDLDTPLKKDTTDLDCFMIYMCLEGSCRIDYFDEEMVSLTKGDTVLIPASVTEYRLIPDPKARLLEVYILPKEDNPEA